MDRQADDTASHEDEGIAAPDSGSTVQARKGASEKVGYVAPRSPTEKAIAAIWSEVLSIDGIGALDDFFDLGGDSLSAVRVIARIGTLLGENLSLYEFFERPTVEQLAGRLIVSPHAVVPIKPADRAQPISLSSHQKRLWFIDRLEGGSTAYHVSEAVRLHGDLNGTALQAALDTIVERHEALRTSFILVGGEPVQRIAPEARFGLKIVDLERCRAEEQEHEVARWIQEDVVAPFDLSVGPLIRGRLLRLSGVEHVLLITMHHMVSDGWSLEVLNRELGCLYSAYRGRGANPLHPLAIQYVDYARWQQQQLQEPEFDAQLKYWTRHLRGAPELLELPTDRPRPPTMSYRGGSVGITLGPVLTSKLKGLAKRLNMTLAMVLYTAWSILLSRLSGQADIVVGMPVANRRRPELEALIGFFVNTLAVRVRLDEDPDLQKLLQQVRNSFLEAQTHQDAPFDKVVDALQPVRSLSYSPVFQVMFVLQNATRGPVELSGLTSVRWDIPAYTAQFDLLLSLQESPEGISGSLNYSSDLFDRSTIERWVTCLESVLSGMDHGLNLKVSQLRLMGEEDRLQVVERFNATRADYPPEKLVHELFEEQVRRTPAAIALSFEERSLTYVQLNAESNQLARYLREMGIGPDCLVGICMERSPEMVIGLLGILKAGGAYVPLDPSYPEDRLAYMLTDAKPKALLTQEHLRTRLSRTSAPMILLDTGRDQIALQCSEDLDRRALGLDSHHLAYVIYTSGSTGKPKGAMNEHRGVVNRLQWMQDAYAIGTEDRVLQKTPFSFDVSVWEFFWTLMSGARLVIARPEGHKDPQYLKELIEAAEVTTLHFVPSVLQIFLDQVRTGDCSSLRHVVCSGEELPATLQRKCFEVFPHARLSNLYGPTEAAVDVTAWECNPEDQNPRVPIGRPISNIRMYVLDKNRNAVPIGVTGEIHIAGIGVGRGYLNRPELTAERFIEDPFSSESGACMYKTGDLGRWRPDGNIEYLGRNDYQVKIRGLRIELQEIEAQLMQHPQIKEAVVLAREDVPGEKRLVAYVVGLGIPNADAALPVEVLRTHLRKSLPDYMVPSAFVGLERLPLNSNGKVDRRTLPAPELGAYVKRQYEAPQGEIEEMLAGIWRGLLRVEQVGRQDNFFELGGHSLLIVQVIERLRRLGLSAQLRSVFESTNLAALASALTRETAGQFVLPPNLIPLGCEAITPKMLPLVHLEPNDIGLISRMTPGGARNIQDIYPLAPLQEGMLFHHLLDVNRGDTYILTFVLSISSQDRLKALTAALQAVIARHDILRTSLLWEGLPRPVQVVQRGVVLPVQEISLKSAAEPMHLIEEWLSHEGQRMDLRHAPLVRLCTAPDPCSDQWYALLQIHHMICDHVTAEAVASEVVLHMEGHAQRLPESIPYRNHIAQVLAYGKTHDARSFFRNKLGDVDESTASFGLLDVLGDGSQIEEARKDLAPGLAQRLRSQARRLGVSAATLFHAAWGLVVGRTSQRNDVVFGTLLLGRLQGSAGAQQTLGVFINTLPLRLQLQGITVRELIEQTQRELVELLGHEQASLAEAQRCSAISGGTPLFNTLLNYRHSVPQSEGGWESARGIRILSTHERTNYPITVSVDDVNEGFALLAQTDRRIDPRRVTEYLRTVLHSLVAALEESPEMPALQLSVLPEGERRQVLELFNATRADYPQGNLIHELFEKQVKLTPQAVAVAHDNKFVTYAEINRRADKLAHILRNAGVGPEKLVGVCVERSHNMIVGVLGILKAGGAYVPLDPNYPVERLQYMLQDAAPRVVLIQKEILTRLPAIGTRCVVLEEGLEESAGHVDEDISVSMPGLTAESLVYVIYTSGSTGNPKGVSMPHRSMVNLIEWHRSTFGGEPRKTLQFAALSFDVAFQEIFTTLCTGGTLELLDEWARRDARQLTELLMGRSIQRLYVPPLMLQSVAEYTRATGLIPKSLRDVVTAGEQLRISPEIASLFKQLDCRLHNHYGPTETHVVTALTLNGDPDQWPNLPPIGCPIGNIEIYVLDELRQPVPLGVTGEIYIGGAGVARGYLGKPELTGLRFVMNSLSSGPWSRLYKTGDLGRWSPDGILQYLGRNDDQVKIRGFRIELGEIEARLARAEQVGKVAVVVREDVPGERRLVAYITQRGLEVVKVEELRAQLKATLPEYMIPSAFVLLEKLPQTPSGKLDRRALPAPELDAYVSGKYEAPQGEIEEILSGIWQGLLRVERVGRHDNFFELGGHSLLIMQMMERLRRVGLSAQVRRVFESPTLTDLATALTPEAADRFVVPPNLIPPGCEAITPQMLPLLELTTDQIKRIVRSVPGGAPNVQDIYPLAPLQEGILFHHLRNESTGDPYILPTALSVSSRERLEELIAALQAAIDRHDVLRTSVLWEQLPRPVQVVYRQAVLPVQVIQLSDDRDPLEQVKELLKPEAQRLDLRQAPLMRLTVAADPHSEQWYVLMHFHHLACDHESLEAMMAEVIDHLEGRTQRLAETIPYRNHVAQTVAYARTHDADGFFRSKLADIDEPTAPFGLLDVHGDSSQIEEAREELDPVLAKRVRAQARRMGTSAAALFHAAWALVLARTSGRDDVVFGNVLLGRLQGSAGAQRILGMFINTLPLRLRLGDRTAQELVEHTQRELVELLGHEQASLAAAQRCSGIVGAAPLFTALFNYRHTSPSPELDWEGASGIRVLARYDRTNYPVTLSVDDLGEGFQLTAQTDQRINPNRLAQYMCSAIRSLADALEQRLQKPAQTLSILPEAELREIREVFNAPHVGYPRGELLHELFEQHARVTPDAVAAVYEGKTLTYAQLNSSANQLARCLQKKGVGPDQLVGICVERSLEMVVGLLGILKAGGAYLPLDPSSPSERLSYMLADAAPKVLLTQGRLRRSLPNLGFDILTLDDNWADIVASPSDNLGTNEAGVQAHHLAYVIYTSGSTGQPKGVMIEHRNVTRLFAATEKWFAFHALDVWTLFHSVAFDFSVWELWGAFLYGGRLVIVPQLTTRSPSEFHRLLCMEGVTVLNQTPSAFAQLNDAQARAREEHLSLRLVIFGGEALEFRTLRPWVARNGAKRPQLVNMYGITETTVHVTYRRLTEEDIESERGSLVGRPIPDLQVHLLDGRSQPVPIGVAGEIHVGGAGVARGYLNRRELTAERFVRDPFSIDPNARLYKSGDLGRWRADGTIEYLGRNDDQVKIRGFRIELGEIEAQLVRHPQITEAAVVAREDTPGEKRLVAYVIARDPITSIPKVEGLRAHLKALLPEHMMPSAFVVLERLPLTANGKLDRRALPVPELASYVRRRYEAPQGGVEETLAGIWRGLLRLEQVGRDDNFFELGGHSLLVLRVLFEIEQSLGAALRVTDVYQNPTLRELAMRISGKAQTAEFVDLAREAFFGEELIVRPISRGKPSRTVLLTGCTGFVGRFLLVQLLAETDAKVFCLVRGRSEQHSMSRLQGTLQKWGLWKDEFERRIVPLLGDLKLPHLGVDDTTYENLCHDIDSIYHCATSMNHLETYAMAKPANVGAAWELLRMATHGKQKLINYISTLSVFSTLGIDAPRVVDEKSSIDHERHLTSQGYAASKWVAEKIFLTAGERGIPCNVFRLGLVWADTQEGRYDELQREDRVFKSCLMSGLGIRNYRYDMPPTPVDYVARAVVLLGSRHKWGKGIFHISSSVQYSDGLFERCNEIAGTSLKLLPLYEWTREVKRLHDEGVSLPVVPLLQFAFSMDQESFDSYQSHIISGGARTHFDCDRTHRELEESGIVAPTVDDDMLRRYVTSTRALLREDELRHGTVGAQSVGTRLRERRHLEPATTTHAGKQ
jgi:amino acid adenylation domain-containing protein/thioester reductase-like protein